MFTKSFTSPRRFAAYVLTILLSSVCLSGAVVAQTPLVISSSPVAVPHTVTNGTPWQDAVSNRGDFVLFDFKTSAMTEFPATGGPQITLGAAGAIAGGYSDSGIAIDPRNNNIYLNNNYNGGLIEFPFDAATGAWDLPKTVVATGLAGNLGGNCGNYFQSAGLAINDNGVMAVATEGGCGIEIFTVPIDASGNFGSVTAVVTSMNMRARTVAIDDAGDISYNEDAGGVAGARFIPAGTTGLTDESGVVRIDPTLGAVQGVSVDRAGNVYVADASAGVYMVPLESGIPNPSHALMLTTAPAQGNASIDQARGVLFLPISTWNNFKDVVEIDLNRVELGSAAFGSTTGTTGTISYYFNGSVTPYSIAIEENGNTADFTLGDLKACGITFKPDPSDPTGKKQIETATPYNGGGSCALPVTFNPHSVGDISASVIMSDSSGNVLATTVLHGVGTGSEIVAAPGTESRFGSKLQTPTQIAVDAAGNTYIADSGLGKVLVYPKGSSTTTTPATVGKGLVAPTGVAVDGAGDLFIADSNSLIEVPYGPNGLNAAGQTILKGSLGTNLKVAADQIGDVFVADPDNQRVVRLRSLVSGLAETDLAGFAQLSAIAVDGAGDLFVANGPSLIEISATGRQILSTSLNGASGLAVDASGAVYITQPSGTTRIPNESGTINSADQIALAPSVTSPTSVAVDTLGNVYLADGTAENLDFIGTNATLALGTLPNPAAQSTGDVQIINDGNAPLNVTGFSNSIDFSETATTCVGNTIAVGASCSTAITFNPGPGDQGLLAAQLLIQSDAANSPVQMNVSGVGASLMVSKTTIAVSATPTVTNGYTITATVAPASGTTPVPTGSVTLTATANGVVALTTTKALVSGTISFNPTTIGANTYTLTLKYGGDRVYGTSTVSTAVTIAAGGVGLVQPAPSTVPTYVLAAGSGSQEPYDGTQIPFYYNYPVVVKTANGTPLVGVPVYNSAGTQTGVDYGVVTYVLPDGTAACSPPVKVNADGTAPLGTQCFTINTSNNQIPNLLTSYTITPVYSGNTNPNYGTFTGSPVTLIAMRNSMVVITSNPASLSVSAGSTVTANLTLTSLLGYGTAGAGSNLNNYSLPLEMECNNLPAHASCTFSYPTPDPSDPNSVAVTTNTPGKVVMTINTNVPVGTSTASLRRNPVVFAAMFGFSLLGLAFGKKKNLRASLFSIVCVLLFSGAVAGVSACSSAQIGATPILTTPKGTYTVTVTAKEAGSKTVAGSTPGTTVLVPGNGNQMSIPFTMSVVVQ